MHDANLLQWHVVHVLTLEIEILDGVSEPVKGNVRREAEHIVVQFQGSYHVKPGEEFIRQFSQSIGTQVKDFQTFLESLVTS